MYLPISFRVTSLALGQSYDCPSAGEVTLKDAGKMADSKRQQNKRKRELCAWLAGNTVPDFHDAELCHKMSLSVVLLLVIRVPFSIFGPARNDCHGTKTCLKIFPLRKTSAFWFEFHWRLLLWASLTICQNRSRQWLGADKPLPEPMMIQFNDTVQCIYVARYIYIYIYH